jgi:hypothetical protein
MRPLALVLVLAACSPASEGWSEAVVELPYSTMEVVDAVARLPECAGVLDGGVIHWRATSFLCGGVPALGCSFTSEKPPRIEAVYVQSAWDGTDGVSTLAHELCHVCGYTDETDASACAVRAREVRGR